MPALSTLVHAPVVDEHGHPLGRVQDLVADLSRDVEQPRLTALVVRVATGEDVLFPWDHVAGRPDGSWVVVGDAPRHGEVVEPCVLLRRDVLDAPVTCVRPDGGSRHGRVSEVLLETDAGGARVLGVDLTARGAWHRLLPARPGAVAAPVAATPMSQVHLGSRAGHSAQLAVPGSLVRRRDPATLAELLSRLPVVRAREVVARTDATLAERAVALMHPNLRSRVVGAGPPPRRHRRLAGWRLHLPVRGGDGRG